MKLVKELPKSIYYSLLLRLKSVKSLTKQKEQLPVIVSLTSILSRLNTLDIVIKALLNQRVLPKKIILWLHKDLENKIPNSLKKLTGTFFEIKFSSIDCPHLKLVESLKMYPNKTIITADDDLIYVDNHLENLYIEHLKNPDCIIGNKAYQIKLNEEGNYQSYVQWRKKTEDKNEFAAIPLGAWGVLYPPKSLPKEVFDESFFLNLAPKADDLWFKCMSVVHKTISIQVENRPKEPIPIIGSQKVSLKQENISNNKNDLQWKKLSDHFNLKKLIFNKEF